MNNHPTLSAAESYALEPSWAVVGASNDASKFGNRIYRTLRSAGYRVRAVNLREREVEGDPAFPNLVALPEVPTVINLVIPPPATLEVVEQAIEVGVSAVWFQPGSENPQAAQLALEHGLDVIEDCILVRHQRFSGKTPPGSVGDRRTWRTLSP